MLLAVFLVPDAFSTLIEQSRERRPDDQVSTSMPYQKDLSTSISGQCKFSIDKMSVVASMSRFCDLLDVIVGERR